MTPIELKSALEAIIYAAGEVGLGVAAVLQGGGALDFDLSRR
jgi:hypothetical protein